MNAKLRNALIVASTCLASTGCAATEGRAVQGQNERSTPACKSVVELREDAILIAKQFLNLEPSSVSSIEAMREKDKWIVFIDYFPLEPGNHTHLVIDECGKVVRKVPGA